MLFSVVQIFYWLALSVWFGAVVFAVMAPAVIHRTVRDARPVLPDVLSVNLEGQHSVLLSQSIIGRLMVPMHFIELSCAAVLLVALIGQWFALHPTGLDITLPLMRTAMFVAATALLIFDWRITWPRMWKHRQEYLDHADEPEIANPALDEFDRAQSTNWLVLQITLGLLLAMILFSANIRQIPQVFSAEH